MCRCLDIPVGRNRWTNTWCGKTMHIYNVRSGGCGGGGGGGQHEDIISDENAKQDLRKRLEV